MKLLIILILAIPAFGLYAANTTNAAFGTDIIAPATQESSRSFSLEDHPRRRLSNLTTIHFHTTHKMGYFMLYRFVSKYNREKVFRGRFTGSVKPFKRVKKGVPTVVVVRDMFDATVSGYLYHKSGHECWLNQYGYPNAKVPRRRRNDWASKVNLTEDVSTVPIPKIPEKGLCQALNATNETIGVGIYLEFAMKKFYHSIPKFRNRNKNNAMFVCFEDMVANELEILRQINDRFDLALNVTNITALSDSRKHSTETGNATNITILHAGPTHATDPDPVLRKRLYAIAREVDCQYFGCEIKRWNEELGCKSRIQSKETNAATQPLNGSNKSRSYSTLLPVLPSFLFQQALNIFGVCMVVFLYWMRARSIYFWHSS
mmetsp:Transcript_10793/g.16576  ORF Transcript_10793/g.16576 Transcript_10793/m.16576 type:complete len:374 (-) Transcript_10793:81-1202(-)